MKLKQRRIVHLSMIRDLGNGCSSTGTLCKKEQWQGGEGIDGGGINVTTNPKEVTCKLCLKNGRFPK